MIRLLPISISSSGETFLDDFARSKNLKVPEAVRLLITESPQLLEFAKPHNRTIDFKPLQSGGRRIPRDVQAKLKSLRESAKE